MVVAKPKFVNAPNSLIPRPAMLWIFAAYIMSLLPHYDRMPIWLMIVAVVNLLWAVLIYLGRASHPGKIIKTAYALTLVGLFILQFLGQFTVNTAVAFFIVTITLKLLEVKYRKDCYIFVFIVIYLLATHFLFSQGFGSTAYILVASIVSLGSLMSLESGQLNVPVKEKLWDLTKISLVTLPLMIILFVFFPRMSPLWTVPLASGQARTGISDQMSPGDIANLSQSSERAFRVTFNGQMPIARERYWRGLILDYFDGKKWSSTEKKELSLLSKIDTGLFLSRNKKDAYQILLEPTQKKWGFALSGSSADSTNIILNKEALVRFKNDVMQPTRYQLRQKNGSSLPTERGRKWKRFLQLPSQKSNPRTRQFVENILKSKLSSDQFINKVMSKFRNENYHYTLKPPRTGDNFVDEFMFDTQRGFCSHYASSLTFMLRLAGIPSRVVVGYQGGEFNKGGNYLIIHQYDAHAWVEAWLPEKGWFRLDPTAMVAPSRIEKGLESAVESEGTFLSGNYFSAARYNNFSAIRWVRMQMDALNFKWQKWVVGYDGENQSSFLKSWIGDISPQKMAIVMTLAGAFAMMLAVFILSRLEPKKKIDPLLRCYFAFCKLFEKVGVTRKVGDTEKLYFSKIQSEIKNDSVRSLAEQFTLSYLDLRYSNTENTEPELKDIHSKQIRQLQHLLKQIKSSLRSSN